MRKLLIPILLFAVVINCHASEPRKTIVSGHIEHTKLFPGQHTITVKMFDYGAGLVSYSGEIDKKGNFKIKFDQYVPQDVMLTQSGWASPIVEAMIVHPGDSVFMSLDYKNINEVKFSGSNAKENADLQTYTTSNYSKTDEPGSKNAPKNLQDIQQFCKALKIDLMKKRKQFIDKKAANKELQTWTLHDIQLRYYLELTSLTYHYATSFEDLMQRSKTITYGTDLEEIYNNRLLNGRGYTLLRYLLPPVDKEAIKPEERIKLRLQNVANSPYNSLTKQMLTASVFQLVLSGHDIDDADQNRQLIDANILEPFIKQPLLKYYQSIKENVDDPKITATGWISSGNTVLDSVIAQNKDKIIYVDIWATWCGPCRAEMPNAEKLKQQYKGKNVAFAAICLGSTKKEWKTLVADLKLSPGQYYSDAKSVQKTILTTLHINAFPHYMIVNKDGGIISAGNGLRPSDPLTSKTLDKLLAN